MDISGPPLLRHLVLAYAIALAFVLALARLRIPPVVALIAAGMLAGPWGIGIVETHEVDTFAEIGIVLLLFTVGLDFSVAEMRRVWTSAVGGGLLQIAGTAAAVGGILFAFGVSPATSVFLGLFVALSSTAIVLRELSERNQVDSPPGRLMIAVLLFQDLCLLVLLLAVPLLSGKATLASTPALLGRTVLAVAAIVAAGRLVLPAFFRLVTTSGRREAFPLAVLLASVGTAWISSLFGISMALGAFLAGLVLAESEFRHQAYAEVRPLRDVFTSLFFLSLGMLVDLGLVVRHLHGVLGISIAVIAIKTLLAAGALLVLRNPLRVAVAAGIGLAQVGEFSFILGRAGLDAGLVPGTLWQMLLAASIVTMMITPALLTAAPLVSGWVSKRAAPPAAADALATLSDHVVILGFGVGGQLIAAALRELHVPYAILELNGSTVRQMRRQGEPIFYGDAMQPDALRAAHADEARAIVAVLSDPDATRRAVGAIRAVSATVPLIVRARYRDEAYALERAGATIAVAEELEASLEVVAQLLARMNLPGNVVQTLVDGMRRESTSARRFEPPRLPLGAIPHEIWGTPVATHEVPADTWAAGRTLSELNLRAETGASVFAVRRGTHYITSPDADLRLAEGDVLYLLGDDSDVLLARKHLMEGP